MVFLSMPTACHECRLHTSAGINRDLLALVATLFAARRAVAGQICQLRLKSEPSILDSGDRKNALRLA